MNLQERENSLSAEVCSYEMAYKLSQLGLKAEHLYFICEKVLADGTKESTITINPETGHTYYPTYTIRELGEILPKGTKSWKHICDSNCNPRYRDEDIGYNCQLAAEKYTTTENTEANARAKMLIYLLENKLL